MKTGYTVGDCMTFSPITLSPEDSIKKCAEVMNEHHVGAILVVSDEKKLEGLVTEQDIVRKVLAISKDPYSKKLSDIMETNLKTIDPDADIFEALKLMGDINVRHLPVVKGGELAGLITGKDILKIEPQLFEILVEKIELKEEHRKPIGLGKGKEQICEKCGKVTDELFESPEGLVCKECSEN